MRLPVALFLVIASSVLALESSEASSDAAQAPATPVVSRWEPGSGAPATHEQQAPTGAELCQIRVNPTLVVYGEPIHHALPDWRRRTGARLPTFARPAWHLLFCTWIA